MIERVCFSRNNCYVGHILEFFNILTSKIFFSPQVKWYLIFRITKMEVASQVAKRLKTLDLRKLGNIRKISKLGGDRAQCPVFFPEISLS